MLITITGLGAASLAGAAPQSSAKPAGPSFEVASIRLRPINSGGSFGISISGSHITISGTLGRLLMEAYEVDDYQILGAPDWARSVVSNYYNILAKAEGDSEPTKAQVRKMLQTLLADRFHLRLHRETRERQVLALVLGKDGAKLRLSQPGTPTSVGLRPGQINGSSLPVAQLAILLSNQMKQVVTDRSGLKGMYDIALRWSPDESPTMTDGPPSIYVAVQEQLGLKLVSEKGNMEVLVVDHVEKPTEN